MFDKDIIPNLVQTIANCLRSGGSDSFAVVSSAVRNIETYNCFLWHLSEQQLYFRDVNDNVKHFESLYNHDEVKTLCIEL